MYNFFTTKTPSNDSYVIDGGNFNHIVNVLRMKAGDQILVSHDGKSHLCQIEQVNDDYLIAVITKADYLDGELPVKITLLQGLPKADKLELIIQKAVELGVSELVPVSMQRSVVKIEEKKKKQKTERWQAIAESGAKQSKRNLIPTVSQPISFKQAIESASSFDLLLIPYENKNGMVDTESALKQLRKGQKIGVIVGPEGGFDESEINLLNQLPNARIISLGKRILRTETAAVTVLSMLMLYAEARLN